MSKKITNELLHTDQETIIAQCTPTGSGAIALLRISGNSALEIVAQMSKLASGKTVMDTGSHTIHMGWVIDQQGNHIDQVMFLLMHAPKTFTGQHTVEITCHNNPCIIQSIIDQSVACGARLAQHGEFTKRAFLHDKIDLVQAEAINELIHAQTHASLKSSLAQLDGSLSNWIQNIEQALIKALAFSESSFEFIEDEDIEFGTHIQEIIQNNIQTICSLKKTFNQQRQIREGIRIAIIGSVNAGKSSLFNALLQQKRAIVTDIAGTTRDSIEASTIRNGNNITFVDTAGLRETDNCIEQEGIQRSFDEAKKADIIILAFDASRELVIQEEQVYQDLIAQYAQKTIFVHNKSDLQITSNMPNMQKELNAPAQTAHLTHFAPTKAITPITPINTIPISSLYHKNIDLLEQAIDVKVKELFADNTCPFLLNKRQFNILIGLEQKLQAIYPLLENRDAIDYEIVSYHLQDAIAHIAEFTGRTASQKSIDLIFKEFCIGK